jgi:hypothetical protein
MPPAPPDIKQDTTEKENDKPPLAEFVYHGTSHAITGNSLIPSGRETERIDGSHAPVVYANSNPRGAYAYALRTDNTLVTDAIGDQPYTVIKDKEKFERNFKGGTIYKFPSALFEFSTPATGASSIDEWTSKTAIHDGGIKVYYVTDPAKAKEIGEAFGTAMQQDGPNQTSARANLINQLLATGSLTPAAEDIAITHAPQALPAPARNPVLTFLRDAVVATVAAAATLGEAAAGVIALGISAARKALRDEPEPSAQVIILPQGNATTTFGFSNPPERRDGKSWVDAAAMKDAALEPAPPGRA